MAYKGEGGIPRWGVGVLVMGVRQSSQQREKDGNCGAVVVTE